MNGSGKTLMPALTRTLLVAAGLILAWRITALGISRYSVVEAIQERRPPDFALAWDGERPETLSVAGQLLVEDDPNQAESLLRRAFNADPSDGYALIMLANLWLAHGDPERADKAVERAERLAPANMATNLRAAAYWLRRGRVEPAIQDWNHVLQAKPALSRTLFPNLLVIAEQFSREAHSGFYKIVKQRLPWWEDFFIFATVQAQRTNTLRALYDLHRDTNQPLSVKQRNAYITRLRAEGLWSEAYLVWLNSLTSEQLPMLGQIYDGGFEQTQFERAFDWHLPTQKGVEVDAHSLFGGRRGKALQSTFLGSPVKKTIAEQLLFLLPGHYRLTGLVKTDSIDTAHGLIWTITCADGDSTVLADSERFVGSNQWREFSVRFSVPDQQCRGQRLSLRVMGMVPGDLQISGDAWFDDLSVAWLRDKTDIESMP